MKVARERYSWDQATILGLVTADGFRAVGIEPATVRKWASRGRITAVGNGPRGVALYEYASVLRVSEGASGASVVEMSQ